MSPALLPSKASRFAPSGCCFPASSGCAPGVPDELAGLGRAAPGPRASILVPGGWKFGTAPAAGPKPGGNATAVSMGMAPGICCCCCCGCKAMGIPGAMEPPGASSSGGLGLMPATPDATAGTPVPPAAEPMASGSRPGAAEGGTGLGRPKAGIPGGTKRCPGTPKVTKPGAGGPRRAGPGPGPAPGPTPMAPVGSPSAGAGGHCGAPGRAADPPKGPPKDGALVVGPGPRPSWLGLLPLGPGEDPTGPTALLLLLPVPGPCCLAGLLVLLWPEPGAAASEG